MYIQHAAMGQLILVGTVVFGHLVGHFLLEPILVCDLTSPGSKNPRNTLLREEAGQKGSTHYFCHFWLSLGIVGPAQVAALYVCFVWTFDSFFNQSGRMSETVSPSISITICLRKHIRLRQEISQYMCQYFCQAHVFWYVTLNVNTFVQFFPGGGIARRGVICKNTSQPSASETWKLYSNHLDGNFFWKIASGLRSNKALRRWLDVPPQGDYAPPNFYFTAKNIPESSFYMPLPSMPWVNCLLFATTKGPLGTLGFLDTVTSGHPARFQHHSTPEVPSRA